MAYKVGETLATHPKGHRLTAYQQDGRWWSALYCRGGFVTPHPDGGWGIPGYDGRHNGKLSRLDLAELQQIMPTGDMPPLLPKQQNLILEDPAADSIFVDWPTFWAVEPDDTRWLYEPVLAKGRGHAIFAGYKVGKSLILLYLSLQLATGPDPVVVIYLDYEMSRDDLEERLTDMGADPDTNLDRLRYALIPALPSLDTPAGADALLTIVDEEQAARPDHHLLVVVDTTARAVAGEENSADTIRAFYRHTGSGLKRRGVTWVRLDHAGKDATKGQRGSSAKGDDVDIVWRVAQVDGGLRLTREAARVTWIPETHDLARSDDPLTFKSGPPLWPAGTAPMAAALDRLGAPTDITNRQARELLKSHGESYHGSTLQAAVRYRKLGPNLSNLVT